MTRQQHIQTIISSSFKPIFLEIENESHKHRAQLGEESHFKVTVVSQNFLGMRLVSRHRSINALLKEEFSKGLHALSLHLFTPEEWQSKGEKVPKSPPCRSSS